VLGGSSAAQNAELDALRAASATPPEVLQQADTLGATAQSAAAAAPEPKGTVAAASVPVESSVDQVALGQTATEQQEGAAATTESFTRQAPAAAEGKAPRTARGS
jgi:hypothetical protein